MQLNHQMQGVFYSQQNIPLAPPTKIKYLLPPHYVASAIFARSDQLASEKHPSRYLDEGSVFESFIPAGNGSSASAFT